MEQDKIRAELCADHFSRLAAGDVCSSCPSRTENEEIVKAMSKVLSASSPEIANAAIITELRSIRRAISDVYDDVEKINRIVTGNGNGRGLDHRLTVIETKLESSAQSKTVTIAIVGTVASILLSIAALIISKG